MPPRKRYVPAVGPKLQKVLDLLLALFAVLGVNAVYLVSVTALEARTGETYQNYFYLWMFLVHLVLGFAIIPPLLGFGILHMRNTRNRKNKRALRAGYGLFAACLILVASGVLLTRVGALEIRDPSLRSIFYWTHVIAPFLVVWLFVLHRLAGRRIKWRIGGIWLAVAAGFALVMALFHSSDPRQWNVVGPESGEQYFFPSLARTSTGSFIPADTLMMDDYCLECHADVHERWSGSAHRFSSFNNPVYLFSVRETREFALERDGDVRAARFCAGCHDPVPFFSGAFDDPNFDDVGHPTAQAGVTCTACHAITHVNSPRGNSDFTIEEPTHYPFAKSDVGLLRWVNRQLVKAKPAFHKATFLKPLHETPEFCGACHKVHLPEELNKYKWLRGQNHYDTYHLSGVSGHGVSSFYYPEKAEANCNGCHMPLMASDDFGAEHRDDSGELTVHDHLFPSANAAVPHMLGMGDWITEAHQEFNEGVMRVDLFGVREEARIDGPLIAPLRPQVPALEPGQSYLLETVIRTLKMGHTFTQGTTDSNQVWLEVVAKSGERIIGQSGRLNEEGEVDPWAHFANSYVLDRDGRRIARRNVHDIFVSLYSHQIPPGAGEVIHYRLDLPADLTEPVEVEVALRYRKFDTELMRFVEGEAFDGNDLPILTLATDRIVFPVDGSTSSQGEAGSEPEHGAPLWQRWNDYGIGLLRKGETGANKGQLRQAEVAFRVVEELGRPDGPLNLARTYLKEGRLDEAAQALERAVANDPPAAPWSVAWFTGLVNKENGFLLEAAESFRNVLTMDTEETRSRGFDFGQDWRVKNELATTLLELAVSASGGRQTELLNEAQEQLEGTLAMEPEDLSAHYNLGRIFTLLGDEERAAHHRALHAKYKPDDNARDRAVASARRSDPAADHAAEAIVIYELARGLR